jgi:hypothetical protein
MEKYETWSKNFELHMVYLKLFTRYFVMENFEVPSEAPI